MKFGRFLVAGLLVFLAALLPTSITSASKPTAFVRFVNAAAQAPALRLYLNSQPLVEPVAFSKVTEYIATSPGKVRVQTAATGEGPDRAPAAETTLQSGMAYTIAAVGDAVSLPPIVLVDQLQSPSGGHAVVRLYHFSPDAPAVDLLEPGQRPLITNLPFPKASLDREIDPGSYQLNLTPATVTAPVLVTLPPLAIEANNIYHVFVIDNLSMIRAITTRVTPPTGVPVPVALPRTAGAPMSDWLLAAAIYAIVIGIAGQWLAWRAKRIA